jgi:4-amino-4-deoxy-L-arabinose transferase-like glycosyltransferase
MERAPYRPGLLQLFIALAVLLNLSGLFVTIMAPDASLYASVAKTMVLKNNYLELFRDGRDWLDKPHFPFWITAISFKLFGFTTWAYKLPGILFMLLGGWYTYKLASDLYNKQIGLWAVLILLTAQHILLSNNDVRAEPYLTGLIIASVYHFYRAGINNSYLQIVLGSLFAGCAIMTKGPFAIIPIGGGIAMDLLMRKDWNNLFNLKWVAAIVLTLVFISPELYSLYYQFDLHPEKLVFGRTHVSGLKFFFWDSQFGRFFNTGPIKGEGDPFFFLHTTLWAFLPWSILLYMAIINYFRKNLKERTSHEWICLSAALVTFLVFSLSKFQLPHYLNIVFPFFAILTAQYIYQIKQERSIKSFRIIQTIFIILLFALPVAVQLLYEPQEILLTLVLAIIVAALIIVLNNKLNDTIKQNVIFSTVLASVFLNIYLNLIFYPSLLHYQAGSEAASWINKNNKEQLSVVALQPNNALEFYLDIPYHLVDLTKDSLPKSSLVFLSEDDLQLLRKEGLPYDSLKTFNQFPVTQLDIGFLNKKTRAETLKQMVVIKSHS